MSVIVTCYARRTTYIGADSVGVHISSASVHPGSSRKNTVRTFRVGSECLSKLIRN